MRFSLRQAVLLLALPGGFAIAPEQGYSDPTLSNEQQAQTSPVSANRAVGLLVEGAQRDLRQGKLEDAENKAFRAVRIDSSQPSVWQVLAQIYLFDKRFSQAEIMAEKSMAFVPGDSLNAKARSIALMNTAERASRSGLQEVTDIAEALEENISREKEQQAQLALEQQKEHETLVEAELHWEQDAESLRRAELIWEEDTAMKVESHAILANEQPAALPTRETLEIYDATSSNPSISESHDASVHEAVESDNRPLNPEANSDIEFSAFEPSFSAIQAAETAQSSKSARTPSPYKVRRPNRRF
jgi:hypothetical protein